MDLGKRLIEKALHGYNLQLDQIAEKSLLSVISGSSLESLNHLFEEVGIGNRPALLVAKQIAKALGETSQKENITPTTQPLIIKGTEGLVLRFAKCCRPIPGDHIGGLIKIGFGIEVHLLHCPLLEKYHHQTDKYVPLSWEEHIEGDFSVDLSVDLVNRRGSLASLTLAISEAESNIENIRAQESDRNHFHVDITISVRNRSHLARILRKIRKRRDVIRVVRHKPQMEGTGK